jgi:small redox-active disulfide protein 2
MSLSIKILGPGCARCKATVEVVKKALEKRGLPTDITKVEDVEEIVKYNILKTPAVVMNEQVKISGRVPTQEEIESLLNQYV